MYIAIDFGATKAKTRQYSKQNDPVLKKKEAFPMSKRELFLVAIVVLLVTLLVVPLPNSLANTTSPNSGGNEGSCAPAVEVKPSGEATHGYFPEDTSPYAKTGIKIGVGATGMNLRE